MIFGKLTTALLLLAAAAAPTQTLANSRVHVRIHAPEAAASANASTSSVELGPVKVDKLDPSLYKIAACAPQTWEIRRKNATFMWLNFASMDAPYDQVIVSALNGTKPQVYNSAPNGISTKPIAGSALKLQFRPSETTGGGCESSGKLPSFTLASIAYQLPKQA